jgi:hypothetical protein
MTFAASQAINTFRAVTEDRISNKQKKLLYELNFLSRSELCSM